MLSLTIKKIRMEVDTNGGRFSCEYSLNNGLNIIRAENSSGKSTLMNAIAYGLGLEAILGPIRNRPFAKSVYDYLFEDKKEEKQFYVKSSRVILDVENRNGHKARIQRDIFGNDKLAIVTEEDNKPFDLFFGSSGHVGSANSEQGYHNWLLKFIEWDMPLVPTTEGKEIPLYAECVFPLFFIEQKRGWSEIQANAPFHYKVKNLKKTSLEFCLDIDSFEVERDINDLENRKSKLENKWSKEVASIHAISESYTVVPPRYVVEDISESRSSFEWKIKSDTSEVSVNSRVLGLKKHISSLEEQLKSSNSEDELLLEKKSIVTGLSRNVDELGNKIERNLASVRDIENKLERLNQDLSKYLQLKRLQTVGSDTSLEFQKCPICDSDMFDSLADTASKSMTVEENLEFLKSQIGFYDSILTKQTKDIRSLTSELKVMQASHELELGHYEKLKAELKEVNGIERALHREKIIAEISLESFESLAEKQTELNDRLSNVFEEWQKCVSELKTKKQNRKVSSSESTLSLLESTMRDFLQSFGFKPDALRSINISRQSLRPEQEGYDIVAENSASDYIRIMWAFTLALQKVCSQKDALKHGGFVVFDEPRQHETNKNSFLGLIEQASRSKDYGGQVIFATSIDESAIRDQCESKKVNLLSVDEYLLKREPGLEGLGKGPD